MDTNEILAAFVALELTPKFKEMENGERRFSLTLPDGPAWIITIAGETGGWQNAHYHEGWFETYAVAEGWVAVGMVLDEATGRCAVRVVEAGNGFCFAPGQAHNIYLPAGAVMHTVKVGKPVGNPRKKGNDWWPAEALDAFCKQVMSEETVLALAGRML